MRKEKVVTIVSVVVQNCLIQTQNTIADQAGRHFLNLYLMFLRQKQITIWVMLGQNIIVKIAVVIMDIYLKMDLIQLAKDIVITVFV